jgi:hypothetical protein
VLPDIPVKESAPPNHFVTKAEPLDDSFTDSVSTETPFVTDTTTESVLPDVTVTESMPPNNFVTKTEPPDDSLTDSMSETEDST